MSSDFGNGVGKCFGYDREGPLGRGSNSSFEGDYHFGGYTLRLVAPPVAAPAPDASAAAPVPTVKHGWLWHLFHPFHKGP